MKVKNIAECFPWSSLQYFGPVLSDNCGRALTNWRFAVLNSHFWCWDSYFLKAAIFFCIVGLTLFGKEGSGTPVFKILVRVLCGDNWWRSWKPIFGLLKSDGFTQVLLYQNLMWWYPIYCTTQGEEQEEDSGPSDDEGGEQDHSVEHDQPDAENTDKNSEVCTFQLGRYPA